jgi:hypothetical protein
MARGKQSRGTCSHCGAEVAKGSVSKHLASCAELKAAVEKAEAGKGEKEVLYRLRIQAAGLHEFWLDVEMRGSATLKQLDGYLRAIWLECCGHLSEFAFGSWPGDTIAMGRRIDKVFEVGTQITHAYDFGTTSETLVKAVDMREGRPLSRHPVTLLFRNVMPPSECIECGEPAAWLCNECLIEEDTWGTLCDKHVKKHPHRDYGDPVALVNSPRMGMCGYTGPAKPPY